MSTPCPSALVLGSYRSGTLNGDNAAKVREHLTDCETCRQSLSSLSEIATRDESLNVMDRSEPPKENSGAEADLSGVPSELLSHPIYRVQRELGRGGMGVVYLCTDRLMQRPVVLKVINGELLKKPKAKDRFLREIRSAAQLHHPNVTTTYAAVQEGDLLAFVMEYVPGVDLAETISKLTAIGRRLPVATACHYIRQAALGLQHVHDKGMVHRDIKPSNLMLLRDGTKHTVKILDFGLAKSRGEKGSDLVFVESSNDPSRTGAGRMLGTPDYMAPEQAQDAATVDIRADIYSLGCSLHYLLTGSPPFHGHTLGDLLKAHAQHAAAPVHTIRSDVTPELSAIIGKAMAKSPESRHQTPAELARDLSVLVKPAAARVGESIVPPVASTLVTPTRVPSGFPSLWESSEQVNPTPFGMAAQISSAENATPTGRGQSIKWIWLGAAGVTALLGVIIAATTIPPNATQLNSSVTTRLPLVKKTEPSETPSDAPATRNGTPDALARATGERTAPSTEHRDLATRIDIASNDRNPRPDSVDPTGPQSARTGRFQPESSEKPKKTPANDDGAAVGIFTWGTGLEPNASAADKTDFWAAIAYSPSTGRWAGSCNWNTDVDASRVAREKCNASDARTLVMCRNGWCALAASDSSSGWGVGCDVDRDSAENRALEQAAKVMKGARVIYSINSREVRRWGSVAFSPSTGRAGYGWGDQKTAEEQALKFCNAADAKILLTRCDGWLALAVGDKNAAGCGFAGNWAEAVRFALGECAMRTTNPRLVNNFCTNGIVAAQISSTPTVPPTGRQNRPKNTGPLVIAYTKALRDPQPHKRVLAASELGELGAAASSAIPALRDAVKDPDYDVRAAARAALARIDAAVKAPGK